MNKQVFFLPFVALSLLVSCGGGSKPTPTPTPVVTTHSFSFNGTNCNINGDANFHEDVPVGESRTYTITPNAGFGLINNDVVITGKDTTFNEVSYEIKVTSISEDIKVTATANAGNTFTFFGTNCRIGNKNPYIDYIRPDTIKTYPLIITDPTCTLAKSDFVVIGKDIDPSWVTFDPSNNTLSIDSQADKIHVLATARVNYDFNYENEHVKINGAYKGSISLHAEADTEIKVVPDEGYVVSKDCVKFEGAAADCATYDPINQKIIVKKLTAGFTAKITANDTYNVKFNSFNCKGKYDGATDFKNQFIINKKAAEGPLVITLLADDDYRLPISVDVTIHDTYRARLNIDYTYDFLTRELTLLTKAPFIIKVTGVHPDANIISAVFNKSDFRNIELICVGNNLIFDWGDGTINNEPSHKYENVGSYDIIITGELLSIAVKQASGNDNITQIKLGPTVKSLPNSAFAVCKNLNTFDIVNATNLETIGDGILYRNTALGSFVLPSSVKTVGTQAFAYCYYIHPFLRNYKMNLVTICGSAFRNCSAMEYVMLPSTLESIAASAFSNCFSLKTVDLTSFDKETNIPTCASDAFSNCSPNLKFYFKDQDTLNKFANTDGWKDYSTRFVIKSAL